MVLYLVRHLRPIIDSGICYGWSDVPAQADESTVELLAQGLACVQAIYSSSLTRCRDLAEALSKQLGRDVFYDDSLKELNFGDWEMKSWDSIGAQALDKWIASGYDAIHEGESLTDFDTRVSLWVQGLDTEVDVAVVTHAGVIRSLFRTVGQMPLEESLAVPIAFGEIVKFEIPA